MPATKSTATKAAAAHGCTLEADFTGSAGGWDLALWAPEGQAFKATGNRVNCALPGQGTLRSEIDWQQVTDEINRVVAEGFEDSDGDD